MFVAPNTYFLQSLTLWLSFCTASALDNYTERPLSDAVKLASSPCIDQTLPTVFYTFGYRGRAGGPATTAMISAYLKTKKRNVILLDWENEAKSGVLGIPLGYVLYAVPNAKKVNIYYLQYQRFL